MPLLIYEIQCREGEGTQELRCRQQFADKHIVFRSIVMRHIHHISRLKPDIGAASLHNAVDIDPVEAGILHAAADDDTVLPVLFFESQSGGNKFQHTEILIPSPLEVLKRLLPFIILML